MTLYALRSQYFWSLKASSERTRSNLRTQKIGVLAYEMTLFVLTLTYMEWNLYLNFLLPSNFSLLLYMNHSMNIGHTMQITNRMTLMTEFTDSEKFVKVPLK